MSDEMHPMLRNSKNARKQGQFIASPQYVNPLNNSNFNHQNIHAQHQTIHENPNVKSAIPQEVGSNKSSSSSRNKENRVPEAN